LSLSALVDKAAQPDRDTLADALGPTAGLWSDLIDSLHAAHDPLVEVWTYSGVAWGWSLRLKRKKRVLVYLTPGRGHFLASFALGEKACLAAHEHAIAPAMLAIIDAAPKYPEGRGVRITVRRAVDVTHVLQIVALKAAR
jgi:hypothetical protein